MKYRVHLTVKGAIHRPPYDGYVDVYSTDGSDLKQRAYKKLKSTSFPDLGSMDYIKIHRTQALECFECGYTSGHSRTCGLYD